MNPPIPPRIGSLPSQRAWHCRMAFVFALAALVAAGCQTSGPAFATPDLSAPGWEVRQGQAVWRTAADAPEIAGDVVLSTHPSGAAFIQFSKTLPLVSARLDPRAWEIDFPPEAKRYSGRGNPPKKLVWLQLLRAWEGERVPERWRLIHPSDRFIALESTESGERLEVQFPPPEKH